MLEAVEENRDFIENLNNEEQSEYIQDLVTSAEVEAEMECDPIAKKAAEWEGRCFRCPQKGIFSFQFEYLNDPQYPDLGLFSKDNIKNINNDIVNKIIEANNNTIKVGCRIKVVVTPKIDILRTIWIRNITFFGISPISTAENLARFLAFKQAYDVMKSQ
jgi:hypothetical protein